MAKIGDILFEIIVTSARAMVGQRGHKSTRNIYGRYRYHYGRNGSTVAAVNIVNVLRLVGYFTRQIADQ